MSNMFAITKCRVHSSNRKLKIYFQSLISFKKELTWINIYDGSEFDLIFNYLHHHYHQLLTIFRLICWQHLNSFFGNKLIKNDFQSGANVLRLTSFLGNITSAATDQTSKSLIVSGIVFSRSKIFVNSSLRILFPRTSKSIHLSSFLELVLFIIRWSLFINVDHLLIKKNIEMVVEFQSRS